MEALTFQTAGAQKDCRSDKSLRHAALKKKKSRKKVSRQNDNFSDNGQICARTTHCKPKIPRTLTAPRGPGHESPAHAFSRYCRMILSDCTHAERQNRFRSVLTQNYIMHKNASLNIKQGCTESSSCFCRPCILRLQTSRTTVVPKLRETLVGTTPPSPTVNMSYVIDEYEEPLPHDR